MHSFVSGLLGGALIGASAAVLLLVAGEILGASGIVSSVALSPLQSFRDPCQHWKWVLLASFGLTAHVFLGYQDKDNALASLSPAAFCIGGFLVGFGTKLSNGCTSGHGICGLARFSKRSLAAVVSFMATGILTAYLTQPSTTPFSEKSVFGFLQRDEPDSPSLDLFSKTAASILVVALTFVALVAPTFHPNPCDDLNCRTKLAPAAVAGSLFAAGLYVSQMVYPAAVLGFLNLGLLSTAQSTTQDYWDPTLLFVMGGGVVVSFLSYQFVEQYNVWRRIRPLSKPMALSPGSPFAVPQNQVIDTKLLFGAACFGVGWGITGLCPGPAIFLASSVGVKWVLIGYWPSFFAGAFLAARFGPCKPCEQGHFVGNYKESVDLDTDPTEALVADQH